MENYEEENEDAEEDDEDQTANSDSDYDSSGDEEGIAYTVASKADFEPIEVKTKVKTRKNEPEPAAEEDSNEGSEALAEAKDNWSQSQQKALESAIKQFPKGTTERWERIANKVPSKTKEQCIQRFKTLAEMVKKKKENQSTAAE